MNIPTIQPGAYFLPKDAVVPLRILKVQNGFIHYLLEDKEFTLSINKLAWIEEDVVSEELTIENLWVEM